MGTNSVSEKARSQCCVWTNLCKACWFSFVEDPHSIGNLSSDCNFGFLKQLIKTVIPTKWRGWLEQVPKWKHPFGHAEGICYLID